jgi:hypothetical protein
MTTGTPGAVSYYQILGSMLYKHSGPPLFPGEDLQVLERSRTDGWADGRISKIARNHFYTHIESFDFHRWYFGEEQVKAFAVLLSYICCDLELSERGRTSMDAWSRAGKKPATDFGVLA